MTGVNSVGMKLPKILLVVCNYEVRSLLRHVLQRAAYTVEECASCCEFLNVMDADTHIVSRFGLIVLDKRLLDRATVNVICRLQQHRHYPPIVLIESRGNIHGTGLDRLRVAAVIQRPTDVTRNVAMIRQLVPHDA